jgi:hypothetical protein
LKAQSCARHPGILESKSYQTRITDDFVAGASAEFAQFAVRAGLRLTSVSVLKYFSAMAP